MKYNKFLVIFFAIAFILVSCEKEETASQEAPVNIEKDSLPVSESYSYDGLDFKVVNFSDIQKDKAFETLSAKFDLTHKFRDNSKLSGTIIQNLKGFVIDTNHIKVVTKENYISYTFKIIRNLERIGFIENLMIEAKNGVENAYIISYTPDGLWLRDFLNGVQSPFYGDVRIEKLPNANGSEKKPALKSSCATTYIIIENSCGCTPNHWPGQDCNCSQQPSRQLHSFKVCDSGVTEGSIGGPGVDGGGSTNDPDPTDDDSVTPITGADGDDVDTVGALTAMLRLDLLQSNWLSHNNDFADIVYTFIVTQEFTTKATAFAKNAVLATIKGGEVDFEEQIIYTSNVSTCVKDIIKKMLNDNEYIDLGDMPDFVKQELNLSGTMLNFFDVSNEYNLIFDSKNNLVNPEGQRLNAKTLPERDPNDQAIMNFAVTLDSDYLNNATDLSIARTVIHETLHAYISFVYQDQMFSDLSNSLRSLLSKDGATPNSAQHILMTQQFVGAISSSLESWDNSSLANNEYYNYLSWSGTMLDSPAFDDLDADTQRAIEDANIAEGSALYPATGQAKGTNNCN